LEVLNDYGFFYSSTGCVCCNRSCLAQIKSLSPFLLTGFISEDIPLDTDAMVHSIIGSAGLNSGKTAATADIKYGR